jgi:hypothetical protein
MLPLKGFFLWATEYDYQDTPSYQSDWIKFGKSKNNMLALFRVLLDDLSSDLEHFLNLLSSLKMVTIGGFVRPRKKIYNRQ